jgi:hypothetical protein
MSVVMILLAGPVLLQPFIQPKPFRDAPVVMETQSVLTTTQGNLEKTYDLYNGCIYRNAKRLVASGESAEAISEAAISICSIHLPLVRDASEKYFAANNIGGARHLELWQSTMLPELERKARGIAISEVVETRATMAKGPSLVKRNKKPAIR